MNAVKLMGKAYVSLLKVCMLGLSVHNMFHLNIYLGITAKELDCYPSNLSVLLAII